MPNNPFTRGRERSAIGFTTMLSAAMVGLLMAGCSLISEKRRESYQSAYTALAIIAAVGITILSLRSRIDRTKK